jgi:general secretion pathway protein E
MVAAAGYPRRRAAPELEKLSSRFLRQFKCVPASFDDSTLVMAMADPLDFETLATIRQVTGLRVKQALAAEGEILDQIDRHYGQQKTSDLVGFEDADANEDLEHLRDMASEAPVIRLVNAMVASAVEKRASDIHIEPFERTSASASALMAFSIRRSSAAQVKPPSSRALS